jgi:cytochrome b
MQTDSKIKVWDPLVRVFHWTLVGTFFIAYVTEEDLLSLHVWAGYLMLAALAVRIVWGFIGTRHARFSDFVTKPSVALQYAKDALFLKAKRYIGHNPAGGLMIVMMIISLISTGMSGVLLYGADEHAGPFASWFVGNSEYWEGVLEEIHEFFANFTLFLVIVHVGGVVLESMAHHENLVRAMWDGYKKRLS